MNQPTTQAQPPVAAHPAKFIGDGSIIINKPAQQYHGDVFDEPQFTPTNVPGVPGPTVSASFLIDCLNKSPAQAIHPQEETKAMSEGSARHNICLKDAEVGIRILDFNDYRKNEAKDARDAALAEGLTPVLRKEFDNKIVPMRDAFLSTDLATRVVTPDALRETSMYFEGYAGIPCRARIDIQPTQERVEKGAGIVDYKTSGRGFDNFMHQFFFEHGGLLRIMHYCLGYYACSGILPNYWLLLQHKDAPYSCQLRQINIGHAVRKLIVDTGQPFVLPDGSHLTEDNTPRFFDEAGTVHDYDATIAVFLTGLPIWKRAMEVAEFCRINDGFPMPPTYNTIGLTPAQIMKSAGSMPGITAWDREGYETVYVPKGFTLNPLGGIQLDAGNTHLYRRPTTNQKETQTHEPVSQPASQPAPVAGTPTGPATDGTVPSGQPVAATPGGNGAAPAPTATPAGPAPTPAGPAPTADPGAGAGGMGSGDIEGL